MDRAQSARAMRVTAVGAREGGWLGNRGKVDEAPAGRHLHKGIVGASDELCVGRREVQPANRIFVPLPHIAMRRSIHPTDRLRYHTSCLCHAPRATRHAPRATGHGQIPAHEVRALATDNTRSVSGEGKADQATPVAMREWHGVAQDWLDRTGQAREGLTRRAWAK